MTLKLPALDVHAHIKSDIDPNNLISLRAIVLAATRSLEEFDNVSNRRDPTTVWGVGFHPAVPVGIQTFAVKRFREALEKTPIVSEIGLDARSSVPMALQERILDESLEVLQDKPRIISIHSAGATAEVLAALDRRPVTGAVLHWWRGTTEETVAATKLGCWFSINQAESHRPSVLGKVPKCSLLTETDHPYGDKRTANGRPGLVRVIEESIADQMDVDRNDVRRMIWANFTQLVDRTNGQYLFPPRIQALLEVARENHKNDQ